MTKTIEIKLTDEQYDQLVFLRDNNYFQQMTDDDVVADLIKSSYREYKDAVRRWKEDD